MYDQKAIKTHLWGFNFRSRLEARWAIFLETLSIKWAYEPMLFDLSNGVRYLPDFMITLSHWLSNELIFLEVKPSINFVDIHKSDYITEFAIKAVKTVTEDYVEIAPNEVFGREEYHHPVKYYIADADFRLWEFRSNRRWNEFRYGYSPYRTWFDERFFVQTAKGNRGIEKVTRTFVYGKPIDITNAILEAVNHRF